MVHALVKQLKEEPKEELALKTPANVKKPKPRNVCTPNVETVKKKTILAVLELTNPSHFKRNSGLIFKKRCHRPSQIRQPLRRMHHHHANLC